MTQEVRTKWREEILSGVETVPKIGVPGLMVVCGDHSEPILTGNTARDVLVAAAEIGDGRMVVFTHDGYVNWFLKGEVPENAKTFYENVLSWVTKGKYSNDWELLQMKKKNLANASANGSQERTVLAWYVPKPKDEELIDDLKTFVSGGGSLIMGVTPWGSLQVQRCDPEDLSAYKFLKEVEIYIVDGYNHISGAEMQVSDNRAEAAHVGLLLDKCHKQELKISELSAEIVAAIGSIPDEDCRALLKEHITGVDIASICRPPHPKKPLKTNEERAAALFVNLVLKKAEIKAPGVQEFPGDFDTPPTFTTVEHKIESHSDEAHPLGAYLAAGHTATVEVVEGSPNGYKVQVGCHSDNLRASDRLRRWPDIVIRKKLETEGETKIYTPFGGLVYIISPNSTSTISVRVKDIVPAPLFRLDDTPDDWNENRTKPGLWADFVGKHMMLSVPSHTIRELDHPVETMQFWDEVVITHNDLKGIDLDKKRRQWMVPDLQPSAGYMHSGYPIVTHMDAADPKVKMFLVRKPKDHKDHGHWGFFHELGHNMQDGMWTFHGTGEVTCNIFALNAMEKIFQIPAWSHPWLEGQKEGMKAYLKNGAKFEEWRKSPGVALGIYAQLARDFGFDTYKKVLTEYETEKPKLKSDQAKIDHWIKTFSKHAESNLVPAFQLWGFPISEDVVKELEGLKEYYPKDEITEVLIASNEAGETQTNDSTETNATNCPNPEKGEMEAPKEGGTPVESGVTEDKTVPTETTETTETKAESETPAGTTKEEESAPAQTETEAAPANTEGTTPQATETVPSSQSEATPTPPAQGEPETKPESEAPAESESIPAAGESEAPAHSIPAAGEPETKPAESEAPAENDSIPAAGEPETKPAESEEPAENDSIPAAGELETKLAESEVPPENDSIPEAGELETKPAESEAPAENDSIPAGGAPETKPAESEAPAETPQTEEAKPTEIETTPAAGETESKPAESEVPAETPQTEEAKPVETETAPAAGETESKPVESETPAEAPATEETAPAPAETEIVQTQMES